MLLNPTSEGAPSIGPVPENLLSLSDERARIFVASIFPCFPTRGYSYEGTSKRFVDR